jgi:hypothetical protein
MLAWLPSIVSLLIGILGQLNAADWVASHPQLAMALGTLGALITALTKSPLVATEPPKPPFSGGRPFLFAILLVLLTAPAYGQTVTVDLNKASLAWDWAKGAPPNDGDATGFTAHCGRTSGVYSANTPINDAAARTVPIRSIVNGQGVWFCAVSAFNRYGTSSNKTNEVSFDAGALPADPARARVQAQ